MNNATSDIHTNTAGNEDQFLTFVLNNEEYGIEIMKVREIRGWETPTVIPQSPEYVKGVINIRGTIVPIIDLRQKFKLPTEPYSKLTVVIITQIQTKLGERVMGIVVDAVSEVYNIATDNLLPPPEIVSDEESQYIQGLASKDNKMIIVLNVDHLLSHDETLDITKHLEKISTD